MKIQMTWDEVLERSLADLIKQAGTGNRDRHARAHTAYENLRNEATSGIACPYFKYQ